jgi:uncharacterized protein (TIGR02118 family)
MIKLVYCIRRRAGLAPEAFRAHWLERHAPLVKRHAAALRAKRYVQSHTGHADANAGLVASRDASEPYDGITEVWWESVADLQAALASPEGQAAARELLEDERRFIDLERSTLFVTDEHEIF